MGLEFFNHNCTAFTVIFSAVVAFATVIYAILTWKLVSETRKIREAQTEPKVSITIQQREEWINLVDMVIQNIALGPAYNIKFEVNPDFEYTKGEFLSELGFMKYGLKYLAPNQNLQFFLTSMIENFEDKTKNHFEIKVIYQNTFNKTYEDVYLIFFSQLIGLSQLGEPPLYKIAKNIESIQKDIHHLSTGFHRMKVIRNTKEDLEEERKQQLEKIKKKRG
ncbi:MAG: hypothetical protein K8R35_05810 [Bacteroidales bacterium]|nr:hypothetical protein [Bacteroidales bacterium]